jgi:hypothetical protein
MKQVVAFNRHHGFDLLTGEIVGPQAGSKLSEAPAGLVKPEPEEEPPRSPGEKKPAKRA